MVRFLAFILILVSFQLTAATYIGKISRIDLAQNQNELPLILMESGMVLKIKPEHKNDLAAFFSAQQNGEKLKIVTNKKRQIVAIENYHHPIQPASLARNARGIRARQP